MSEVEPVGVGVEPGSLFLRVSALVEQTRATVASQANTAITLLYWEIGRLIDVEVLQRERAEYAQQIVASLGRQLTERFGRGFDRANLYRMVQFAQVFPDHEIVASLGQQLSWTHFKALLPVRTPEARAFYIEQALTARLSVRALRELIGRQGFERREIANAQTPGGSTVPADTFRDPYFLDFLGLKDAYQEQDLEEAIIREMEAFLLEVGNGRRTWSRPVQAIRYSPEAWASSSSTRAGPSARRVSISPM